MHEQADRRFAAPLRSSALVRVFSALAAARAPRVRDPGRTALRHAFALERLVLALVLDRVASHLKPPFSFRPVLECRTSRASPWSRAEVPRHSEGGASSHRPLLPTPCRAAWARDRHALHRARLRFPAWIFSRSPCRRAVHLGCQRASKISQLLERAGDAQRG